MANKSDELIDKNLLQSRAISSLPENLKAPSTNKEDDYMTIYNAPATNTLTRTHTTGKVTPTDLITGRAQFTRGKVSIFIDQYNDLLAGLRPSTHKLLDALTRGLTEQNHYKTQDGLNLRVEIDLEDYMRLCGKNVTPSSKKNFRRELNKDLDILYNTSLKWEENIGRGRVQDYDETRIISRKGIVKGKIGVTFTEELGRYFSKSYIMQYPSALFKLDNRNPIPYYLGRKLALHYSMDNNRNKGTHNIISVKALLEHLEDTIPTYEEVMEERNRNLRQHIIEPLEKALEILEKTGIIRWEYSNSKKTPLTDEQLLEMDYDTFIDLYIKFDLLKFPDQTERLTERNKEKAKKSKAKEKAKIEAQAKKQVERESKDDL